MKKLIFIITLLIICISDVNAASITDQINNLKESINDLTDEVDNINNVDKLYPIGSIYVSVSETNPSELFGGTWERYAQGRQIVGYGSNGTTSYSYNATGGSTSKTLAIANIPAHTHTLTPLGTITSTFKGTAVNTSTDGEHTHTFVFGRASEESRGHGYGTYGTGDVYGRDLFLDRVIIWRDDPFDDSRTAGAHTHTLTPEGTVESKFTGTETTTSSIGNGESFSIQNPYITVYMWKRTA